MKQTKPTLQRGVAKLRVDISIRHSIKTKLKRRIESRMTEIGMEIGGLSAACGGRMTIERIQSWLMRKVTLTDDEFTKLMDVLVLAD